MLAPAGAPAARLNVSICGGWSVSVALTVKLNVWPTVTSRSPMVASTGAVLGMTFAAAGVGVGMKKRLAAPSG